MNYGKIKHIREFENHTQGFLIKTTTCKIILEITNSQCCCERFGSISSEDDFDEFIDAKILELNYTDENRVTIVVGDFLEDNWYEEAEIMFLTLETDKGPLQFVVYNIHNGYYSHRASIKVVKDGKETTLEESHI